MNGYVHVLFFDENKIESNLGRMLFISAMENFDFISSFLGTNNVLVVNNEFVSDRAAKAVFRYRAQVVEH